MALVVMKTGCLLVSTMLASLLGLCIFFKPVRVVAASLAGVQCLSEQICVDDASRVQEAQLLASEAFQFVEARLGSLRSSPRLIFCATEDCAESFGLGTRAAYTLGTYGIVVAPRGWAPYYVRHELIHHVQNEHLGSLRTWLFKPAWFVEGMAYSISEDPRSPLPARFEVYRSQFDAWYRAVGMEDLWSAAEAL